MDFLHPWTRRKSDFHVKAGGAEGTRDGNVSSNVGCSRMERLSVAASLQMVKLLPLPGVTVTKTNVNKQEAPNFLFN